MMSLESQRVFQNLICFHHLSKWSVIHLFCYVTNRLLTGPLGNSGFCFLRISMFPEMKSRETLSFSGNKILCSPRDQSLGVKCDLY